MQIISGNYTPYKGLYEVWLHSAPILTLTHCHTARSSAYCAKHFVDASRYCSTESTAQTHLTHLCFRELKKTTFSNERTQLKLHPLRLHIQRKYKVIVTALESSSIWKICNIALLILCATQNDGQSPKSRRSDMRYNTVRAPRQF